MNQLTTTVHLAQPAPPSDTIIKELEYASNLLLRADAAISREWEFLRGGGVHVDWTASLVLSVGLVGMAAQLSLLAMQCKEAAA